MSPESRPRPTVPAYIALAVGGLALLLASSVLATASDMRSELGLYLALTLLPLLLGLGLIGRFLATYVHAKAALATCAAMGLVAFFVLALRLKHFADQNAAWARSRAVYWLCEKAAPIADAPALGGSAPHAIRIAELRSDPLDQGGRFSWHELGIADGYPTDWQTSELPELVACLRDTWTEHERKLYQTVGSYGSKPIEVVQFRQSYEIDVYEAKTRRLVTHLRVDGPMPPPLPKESKGDPQRRGPRATAPAVLSALQPIIQGR